MAKIVNDKSVGASDKGQKAAKAGRTQKSSNAPKAQAKQAGRIAGALPRSSSRASAQRPSSSSAPRGTISSKPRGRVRTFFREVRVEMGKVTWPSRKELIKATGVVIIVVIIAGAYIGVFDFIWNLIVRSVGLG